MSGKTLSLVKYSSMNLQLFHFFGLLRARGFACFYLLLFFVVFLFFSQVFLVGSALRRRQNKFSYSLVAQIRIIASFQCSKPNKWSGVAPYVFVVLSLRSYWGEYRQESRGRVEVSNTLSFLPKLSLLQLPYKKVSVNTCLFVQVFHV